MSRAIPSRFWKLTQGEQRPSPSSTGQIEISGYSDNFPAAFLFPIQVVLDLKFVRFTPPGIAHVFNLFWAIFFNETMWQYKCIYFCEIYRNMCIYLVTRSRTELSFPKIPLNTSYYDLFRPFHLFPSGVVWWIYMILIVLCKVLIYFKYFLNLLVKYRFYETTSFALFSNQWHCFSTSDMVISMWGKVLTWFMWK